MRVFHLGDNREDTLQFLKQPIWKIDFTGQWIGHFAYEQEYGEDIAGEKVQFQNFY